jgi:hypothetical protein
MEGGSTMPKQTVNAKLQVNTPLATTGVTLEYYRDDDFIGYLNIGKATLAWTPKHGKKYKGKKSWEELIDWIES